MDSIIDKTKGPLVQWQNMILSPSMGLLKGAHVFPWTSECTMLLNNPHTYFFWADFSPNNT